MQNPIDFLTLGSRLTSAIRFKRANPLQVPKRSGVLVILDVHGVLVEKTAGKDRDRRRVASARRRYWRTFKNGTAVWLRPHLSFFLDVLYARHEVAIWSSAVCRNILPLLSAIDSEYVMKPALMQRLAFLWDRENCRKDYQSGKYSTLKRVDDVWKCEAFGQKYNAGNTLLLDDSPSKVRYFPNSSIVVPEYTAMSLGEWYNKDDTLLWLLLYIEYLVVEGAKIDGAVTNELDISRCRDDCLSFKAFKLVGKLEAKQLVSEQKLCFNKSLALVFLDEEELEKSLLYSKSQSETSAEKSSELKNCIEKDPKVPQATRWECKQGCVGAIEGRSRQERAADVRN